MAPLAASTAWTFILTASIQRTSFDVTLKGGQIYFRLFRVRKTFKSGADEHRLIDVYFHNNWTAEHKKNVYRKMCMSLPCMVVSLQKSSHSVLLECSPEATRKKKCTEKLNITREGTWICLSEDTSAGKGLFLFSAYSTTTSGELWHTAAPPAHRQQRMKQWNQLDRFQKKVPSMGRGRSRSMFLRDAIKTQHEIRRTAAILAQKP